MSNVLNLPKDAEKDYKAAVETIFNNQSFETCKKCYEKGVSCCKNFNPILTYEEAARIYFEFSDIDKMDLNLTFVDKDHFMYVPSNRVKGEIEIDKEDCPFLAKDGSCRIYEFRPEICKMFNTEKYPCFIQVKTFLESKTIDEFTEEEWNKVKLDTRASQLARVSDILKSKGGIIKKTSLLPKKVFKVKKFTKKDLKNMKEDMLLYMSIYHIFNNDSKDTNPYFKVKYEYLLGETSNKKINAVRINIISTEINELKPLARFYNRVNRIYSYYSTDYLEVMVAKLNKVMAGVAMKDIDEELLSTEKQSIALGAFMVREYQTNYKMKSDKFKGLITTDELWNIVKFFVEESGGYENENMKLLLNKPIKDILNATNSAFKAIMKQR